VIRRGEVWWVDLPEPVGSEPGYRRPAVVVQSDAYTRGDLRTVLVVLLTSNPRLGDMPGNVRLPSRMTGLPRDSVANVTQIYTADISVFLEQVGHVPPSKLRQIEAGLRMVLDL